MLDHNFASENNPALSRRNLLAAASASMLVPASAAASSAGTAETPVMKVYREWVAAKEVETAAYAVANNDAAQDAAWDARHAIEKRIMTVPSETLNDWALKMAAWSNFGEGDCQDERQAPMLWAEARALIVVTQ